MNKMLSEEEKDFLCKPIQNGFLSSIRKFHAARGYLTEKQYAAFKRIMDTEETMNKYELRMNNVSQVLESAMFNKKKNPKAKTSKVKLLFGDLSISTSTNSGLVWINGEDRETYGNFKQDALCQVSYMEDFLKMNGSYRQTIYEKLCIIEQDPYNAVTRYGKETGVCCCCGRTLTDPVSIDAGIGPICAGRYFGISIK